MLRMSATNDIYLSIYLLIYLCIYVSMYLSIYASIYLSINLSTCLPICCVTYLCIFLLSCRHVPVPSSFFLLFHHIMIYIYIYKYICIHALGIALEPPNPGPYSGVPLGGLGGGNIGKGYRGEFRRW